MGFRCERCGYEWIPRDASREPAVCPNRKCKSPYWNRPRRPMTTYDDFARTIQKALRSAPPEGLTWTEIRTSARLPQSLPNNQWVRRLEKDIGLRRERDSHGIIHWTLQ
jgi:hypothetical protein